MIASAPSRSSVTGSATPQPARSASPAAAISPRRPGAGFHGSRSGSSRVARDHVDVEVEDRLPRVACPSELMRLTPSAPSASRRGSARRRAASAHGGEVLARDRAEVGGVAARDDERVAARAPG